jgi:nucleotide-binding universal stress UspA family protein
MSARHDERPVVVVAHDHDVEEALRYAAQEARRHGSALWVAYSHDTDAPTDEAVLARAVARASELAGPGIPVAGRVVAGPPVASVLSAFPEARTAVLRHRDVLHLLRTLTSDLAAAIDTPVVCVPPHWTGADPDVRPVTVGVERPRSAAPLVRAAAEEAAARGVALQVLHVRDLRDQADADDERAAQHDLDEVVGALGVSVPVRVEIDHGEPTESLLAAARESQLLVLGRNRPRDDVGSRMGRAARTLLHDSQAPLLVLPPAQGVAVPR